MLGSNRECTLLSWWDADELGCTIGRRHTVVHNLQDLSPQQQVVAAKERLRLTTQAMGQELGQTADQRQSREEP